MNDFVSLTDHFLIAMPGLDDPFFGQSLVYLFEHSPEGAMGLVINQPTELHLSDVLDQLQPDKPPAAATHAVPVFAGGPVQVERGFVLHPAGHQYQSTHSMGQLSMTNSRDILDDIATGQGPGRYLIALGYSGWGAGQLEDELGRNSWLSCPAQHPIMFDTEPPQRREAAARLLGIDLSRLSSQAGHA